MKKAKIIILLSIVLIGGIVLASLLANLRERKASEAMEKVPKVSTGGADMKLEKVLIALTKVIPAKVSWQTSW